jgi:hypothetical protein
MNRRILVVGIMVTVLGLLLFSSERSNAQDGGSSGRYHTIEIDTPQYIWELVSNSDGQVICRIIVDHPNRPTQDEISMLCAQEIYPPVVLPTFPPTMEAGTPVGPTPTSAVAAATPVATAVPFDLDNFFQGATLRLAAVRQLKRTIQIPLPDMILHVSDPVGSVGQAYIIISAYEPVYDQRITGIFGEINGQNFQCRGNRCQVPVRGNAILAFWAESSLGDKSRQYVATLREVTTDQGRRIELTSRDTEVVFQDSCAIVWGMTNYDIPDWAVFPPTPDDLRIMKPFQFLSAQLLSARIVDASDCPGQGFYENGAPNPCGLERASRTVIEWQNQYDVPIWDSGLRLGVPPRLIKALFEKETQFWPGNSGRGIDEYGLGQLSQAGADVALRWDNELFNSICKGLLLDCSTLYASLPGWLQATLRGGVMRAINADCPDCPNGVDLARAYDSVPIFTRILRANCHQVKFLAERRDVKPSYEDMWRFTLVSYHSGYQCLNEALFYTRFNRMEPNWENVSGFLKCPGATAYVDSVWEILAEFDRYHIKSPITSQPQTQPTFAPTIPPVPTRTLTPVPALGHIRVVIYVDFNGNQRPDPGEMVHDAPVEVSFADGTVLTGRTTEGEVRINLSGRTAGETATINLPGLYRSQRVRVTRDGEIPVIFRFDQPAVPPGLP